mmetsp:Transcript_54492/g.96858  ORF Transcript_54492/g.96858 Transcript_54492/m.96858 type:complete len:91 (+) Transcript_54492:40-312(+)
MYVCVIHQTPEEHQGLHQIGAKQLLRFRRQACETQIVLQTELRVVVVLVLVLVLVLLVLLCLLRKKQGHQSPKEDQGLHQIGAKQLLLRW